jgi:XTP/dITP diphosphohydrolase
LCSGFRGAPGIYSARYAGEHGDDAANNAKLLNDLKPFRKMVKRLKACLCAYCFSDSCGRSIPQIFQGIWHGEILEAHVVKMVLVMTHCSGCLSYKFLALK